VGPPAAMAAGLFVGDATTFRARVRVHDRHCPTDDR
jgi:hypothetical protein